MLTRTCSCMYVYVQTHLFVYPQKPHLSEAASWTSVARSSKRKTRLASSGVSNLGSSEEQNLRYCNRTELNVSYPIEQREIL